MEAPHQRERKAAARRDRGRFGRRARARLRGQSGLARDRLWTEVVRRYDLLYQAGVAIWGRRGVDAHLPALQSRVVTAPAAAPGKGEAEEKPV